MGGRASSASKAKWNRKTYDQIQINVPKGQKEAIKQYAESIGLSANELIRQAIEEKTGIDLKRHIEEKENAPQ